MSRKFTVKSVKEEVKKVVDVKRKSLTLCKT